MPLKRNRLYFSHESRILFNHPYFPILDSKRQYYLVIFNLLESRINLNVDLGDHFDFTIYLIFNTHIPTPTKIEEIKRTNYVPAGHVDQTLLTKNIQFLLFHKNISLYFKLKILVIKVKFLTFDHNLL